jgi:hypothetical protein
MVGFETATRALNTLMHFLVSRHAQDILGGEASGHAAFLVLTAVTSRGYAHRGRGFPSRCGHVERTDGGELEHGNLAPARDRVGRIGWLGFADDSSVGRVLAVRQWQACGSARPALEHVAVDQLRDDTTDAGKPV